MPSLRGPSYVPIEHEDNGRFDDQHLPFITNHDSFEGHGDDTLRRWGFQPWFLLVNGMVFCLSISILLVAIIYVHRSMLDINLVRKTSFYCKHLVTWVLAYPLTFNSTSSGDTRPSLETEGTLQCNISPG
jgi:hypothetical protein